MYNDTGFEVLLLLRWCFLGTKWAKWENFQKLTKFVDLRSKNDHFDTYFLHENRGNSRPRHLKIGQKMMIFAVFFWKKSWNIQGRAQKSGLKMSIFECSTESTGNRPPQWKQLKNGQKKVSKMCQKWPYFDGIYRLHW